MSYKGFLFTFDLPIFESAKFIALKLKNSTSSRIRGSRDSDSFNFLTLHFTKRF